jgi:hypothetical protein
MQWQSDNNYSKQLFDIQIADGIDLRAEFHTIVYGSLTKKPLGHWVILRHFDREEKSSYWNPYSKEGVGGPPNTYTDTLLRTRRVPQPRSNTESVEKIGDIFNDQFIYYFEYTTIVKAGDQVYELDTADHTNTPTTYSFTEKYDIKRVHPYRMENGNTQYYAVICEYNTVTY